MSTIHGTIERRQVTTRRQVFSPLEIYWAAFQEWRKRTRLQADLIDLSDRELMDYRYFARRNRLRRLAPRQ